MRTVHTTDVHRSIQWRRFCGSDCKASNSDRAEPRPVSQKWSEAWNNGCDDLSCPV